MKRIASIEMLRILLMFGICMCHSIGAGGHACEPLRNVFMMCTVGFIFITGWFGIRLSAMGVIKLLGIAMFAWLVVACEDFWLHGAVKKGPVERMMEWWFLRTYLMLMIFSPVLNSIIACLTSRETKVRRDAYISVVIVVVAIYAIAWPMHCLWLPQIRLFLTVGCPCQPGTMCVIYLLARVVRVTDLFSRISWKWPALVLLLSVGLAIWTDKFSYYNSPTAFMFAGSIFYFFNKISMAESSVAKWALLAAPSMFFIYLYHSHGDPGFVILRMFQCWLINGGMPIPVAWIVTAGAIFVVGMALDSVRRIGMDGGMRVVRYFNEERYK